MFTKLDIGAGQPVQFERIERKESQTYSAIINVGNQRAIWSDVDYASLAKKAYQLNADVYACVNLIARSARSIPWMVTQSEGGRAATRGPALDLLSLLKRPNEDQSESDFKEYAISYLLLSGNSYIERAAGSQAETTPPTWLYSLRPDRITIKPAALGRPTNVTAYEYSVNGKVVQFRKWEMLHLKLFHPTNDLYGMSPLEAAMRLVDGANESASLYKRRMESGMVPGILSVEELPESDTQLVKFRADIERRRVASQDIILDGVKDWIPMGGLNPIEAGIFEGRKFTKRDIAAIYGVPSEMIGDTESKTFANYAEARRSLYTEAVIPALTHLRDGLNAWLSPLFGNAYIDFDRDAIDALAEDREIAGKRVSLLFEKGVIRRNEGRAELGYDEVPDDEDGYYSEVAAPVRGVAARDGGSDQSEGSSQRVRDSGSDLGDLLLEDSGNRNRRANQSGKSLVYAFKSLNLLTEEQKDTHWKTVDDQRNRWVDRVASDIEQRFRDEANDVVKAFQEGSEASAIRAVAKQEDAWLKLYRGFVPAVAEDFGRRTLEGFKSDGYEYEAKANVDIFDRTVQDWLSSEGAKRVVGVLETTKEKIRRELKAGVDAGESTFELSKRLQAMYKEFGLHRAERISRTEVISASNLGSQTAARATNLPLEKEWLSTRDDRTREDHRSAHGQKRDMDKPYEVGGSRLMYPGDGSLGAAADELVMCRCTETYRVKRG